MLRLKKCIGLCIGLCFLFNVTYCFAGAYLPRGSGPGYPAIQVFSLLKDRPVKTILVAGIVDVSECTLIVISVNLNISYDGEVTTYPYIANTVLGVGKDINEIWVSAPCKILWE